MDPGQARSFLAHILNNEARSRDPEILLALIPGSSHNRGPSLCFLFKPCLATGTTPIPTPTGVVLEKALGNEPLCCPLRGVDPVFWEAPTSWYIKVLKGMKRTVRGGELAPGGKQEGQGCPSHTVGAEVSVTQFPTRKPERATLPDWVVMRSGQQAGFCHPLPGPPKCPYFQLKEFTVSLLCAKIT